MTLQKLRPEHIQSAYKDMLDSGLSARTVLHSHRVLSQALIIGGIVGGIGVSGAPGPDLDDVCAQAGIDAIADRIAF